MNKVVVGAAVLAALAGASVGMGAWSGPKVATGLQEHAAQWARAFPHLQVLDQQVTTGLMHSTHEITLQAGCVPPAGSAGAGDAPPQAFRVTLRDHIQHGPFPGGRSVGLAAIDTELILSPEAAAQVERLMGKQALLRIHTALGFGGGYVTEVSSPAFKFEEGGKGRMEWQGLKMEVRGNFKGGLAAGAAYTLEAPGMALEVTPPEGLATSLKVGRIGMQGDVLPSTAEGLWIRPNKGTATLSSLEVVTHKPALPGARPQPVTVVLEDLQFGSESTIDKDLLSAVSQLSGKGRVDAFVIDKVEMQVALRRLHAATYQQMVARQMDALLSCGQPADREALQKAAVEELQAAAATLVRHDPEYALDKFAIELGGQRAELAYNLGTRGVTEADGALPIAQLLGTRGYANATLKVQNGWIDQFARQMAATTVPAGQPDAEAARQTAQSQTVAFVNTMIDGAAAQGFVVRDAEGIKATAKFESGQLQLNGKAMPLPALPGLGR